MWLLCLDRVKSRLNQVKAWAGCASAAAEKKRGCPWQDEDMRLRDGRADGDEDCGPTSRTANISHSVKGWMSCRVFTGSDLWHTFNTRVPRDKVTGGWHIWTKGEIHLLFATRFVTRCVALAKRTWHLYCYKGSDAYKSFVHLNACDWKENHFQPSFEIICHVTEAGCQPFRSCLEMWNVRGDMLQTKRHKVIGVINYNTPIWCKSPTFKISDTHACTSRTWTQVILYLVLCVCVCMYVHVHRHAYYTC